MIGPLGNWGLVGDEEMVYVPRYKTSRSFLFTYYVDYIFSVEIALVPKKFLFLVPVIFALFAIFWSGWLINNNNDDMTDSEYSAKKVLKTSV